MEPESNRRQEPGYFLEAGPLLGSSTSSQSPSVGCCSCLGTVVVCPRRLLRWLCKWRPSALSALSFPLCAGPWSQHWVWGREESGLLSSLPAMPAVYCLGSLVYAIHSCDFFLPRNLARSHSWPVLRHFFPGLSEAPTACPSVHPPRHTQHVCWQAIIFPL